MNTLQKLSTLLNKANPSTFRALPTQLRPSSYFGSPLIEDVKLKNVQYELSKNPEDWKFVERILPPTLIPTPTKKEIYPSGWKPQAEYVDNKPYFIPRSKNHMIPVYLKITDRGVNRKTIVRKIQGDIWLLSEELKEFIQKDQIKPVRMHVNEFHGIILIQGDHVNAIKYWLEKRDF